MASATSTAQHNSPSTTNEAYDQAISVASDAAEMVTDGAKQAYDYVAKAVEDRPYTVAFGALALGWLLGRFHHGSRRAH